MASNMFGYIILIFLYSKVSYEIKQDHDNPECVAEYTCGVVRGLPGIVGLQGITGPRGPIGPPGYPGPPGRDGFADRPAAFCAELFDFDITNTADHTLELWILSDSYNLPSVSELFSEQTGIFTVPTNGLYQFFLTVAISKLKALFYVKKNDQRTCAMWMESTPSNDREALASNVSNGFIDCILYCQVNDKISIVVSNVLYETSDLERQIYSYSMFSGYMLFDI